MPLDSDICRRGSTLTAVLLIDILIVKNGVIVEHAVTSTAMHGSQPHRPS